MQVGVQGGSDNRCSADGNTTYPYHAHSVICPEKNPSLNTSLNGSLVDHQRWYIKVFFTGKFCK